MNIKFCISVLNYGLWFYLPYRYTYYFLVGPDPEPHPDRHTERKQAAGGRTDLLTYLADDDSSYDGNKTAPLQDHSTERRRSIKWQRSPYVDVLVV